MAYTTLLMRHTCSPARCTCDENGQQCKRLRCHGLTTLACLCHNDVLLCRHEKKKNMYSTLRQLEFIENANTNGIFHDAPEVCVVAASP